MVVSASALAGLRRVGSDRREEPDSGRAEPLLLSVNEVVDRSGIEPLTSSVQAHQLVCQWVSLNAAEYASERETAVGGAG